jgi:hypothetical protein
MGLEPPSPLQHRLAVVGELRAAIRAARQRDAGG